MNLKNRRINITEIITILLTPENFVNNPYFPSVLSENTEIQAEFGADNRETFEAEYSDWNITMRPDQILDDHILEFKVKRPYTKLREMANWGYVQGLLQAFLLGKERFRLVVVDYNPSEKRKNISIDKFFQVNQEEAKSLLDEAIRRINTLRELLKPIKLDVEI